jgi:hypothetical protein
MFLGEQVHAELQALQTLHLWQHSSTRAQCCYTRNVQLQIPPTTWQYLQMIFACSVVH